MITSSPILNINPATGLPVANQPSTSDIIINALTTVKNNPAAMASVVLSELEQLNGGTVRIVDPTNPVLYSLESAVMLSAAAMAQAAALTRRLYPSLAQTENDLAPHMTDSDYLNRFGSPANTTFVILLDFNEFVLKAVQVPNSLIKQITIPRYTEIDVAGIPFTLQYPIDIQYSAAGGIQVRWDTSSFPSPILNLTTNALVHDFVTINGTPYIRINVPMQQMQITSYNATTTTSTGFSKTYTFQNQFYYCRAFIQNVGSAGWTEIATTQSALVYDPTVPTLVVGVNTQTNVLTASIPLIYQTNGLINNNVRIDIYTIQGPMNVNLANYSPVSYVAYFNDLDGTAGAYGAVWQMFSGKSIYSDQYVTGGSNGLTFAQLRAQVMNNSYGQPNVPITAPQIQAGLSMNGFDLMVDEDSLMKRNYLATAPLPTPSYNGAYSSANAAVLTLQASIAMLDGLPTAYWNGGSRLAMRPSTLFQYNNGVLQFVPSSVYNNLVSLANANNTAQLAMLVNAGTYVYSPFHYIYDVSNNSFVLRPYYMTNPTVSSKYFIAQNLTIPMSVSTGGYLVEYKDLPANGNVPAFTGYKLYLITSSGSTSTNAQNFTNFQNAVQAGKVGVQLSYQIPGLTNENGYIAATQLTPITNITGLTDDNTTVPNVKPSNISNELWQILLAASPAECLVEFDLATNFDIDSNNNMMLTNVSFNSSASNQDYPCLLETSFTIVYLLLDYYAGSSYQGTQIDSLIDTNLFSTRLTTLLNGSTLPLDTQAYAGLSQESIDIVLGTALTNLWQSTRTVSGTINYETYAQNIPALYTQDVYQTGPTGSVVITVDANGNPVATKIHSAGDPVLDNNGNPVYLHHAGDYILDANNNPIPQGGSLARALVYAADLFVLDGRYYFATDSQTQSYINQTVQTVVAWIVDEIAVLQTNMLERTQLFFYPKTTIGTIGVSPGNGLTYQINSEQSLTVTFDLDANHYNDTKFKNNLISTVTPIIASMLNNNVVAVPAIENAITTALVNEILGVTITGLGGAFNFRTITLSDSSIMPSIAKIAVVQADYSLAVQDNITYVYNKQGN